jgi:hypothetical protein
MKSGNAVYHPEFQLFVFASGKRWGRVRRPIAHGRKEAPASDADRK